MLTPCGFPDSGPLLFFHLTRETISPPERIPADWWQAVRQRWAPFWTLRRWPLTFRTVRAVEQITVRRILDESQSPPQVVSERIDCTTYEHGPGEIEILRCEGDFCAAEDHPLRPGSELRIEAPDAGVWWDARVKYVGRYADDQRRIHWTSEGAPHEMTKKPAKV